MTHCVNGAWTTTAMTCTGRCCNTVTVCVRFYIKKKLYYVIIEWRQNIISEKKTLIGYCSNSFIFLVSFISANSILLNQTIEEWIEDIKKELTVDKKATSAYTRSLISVYDARPSAVAIGGVGIGMLCLVGLILLLPDLINIFRYCCESSEKDWLHDIFGLYEYSRVCHFFCLKNIVRFEFDVFC